MSYAAFFKTHKWNPIIERQYERFKKHIALGDIYILFDETNGSSNCIPDRYKNNVITIDKNNISSLGLPDIGTFWFNGDYSSIISLFKKPEYNYYCFLEYDVYTKINIDSIIIKMQENSIDIIGEEITCPNFEWPHISSCSAYYSNLDALKKALFCVGFFSRKALVYLYARRLQQNELYNQEKLDYIPIGEAVMATEAQLSGLKYEDLHNFCDDLEHYDWNNGCTEDISDNLPCENTFIHPVYDYEKFIRSNFYMGRTKIDEKLMEKLKFINDFNVFSLSYHLEGNTEEDKQKIFDLYKINMKDSFDYINENIVSYGKNSFQSSFSNYSVSKNEATRALNLIPRNTYSFHTDQENNPWWILDLESTMFVKNIYLFDRPDIDSFRSQNLQIFVGENLENMTPVFKNENHTILSNIKIPVNETIKYVMVVIEGFSILHLDTVIVTS